MKIYAAAVYTSNLHLHGPMFNRLDPREKVARNGVRFILESYHYVHKDVMVERMRRDKQKVFLDSGAFSAHMLGASIDIDKYIAYIKKNQDIITVASVLDGIGDPKKTYENQCYMEKHGTKPLPCFHYGEDERYLEHYIENYDYISLGGMVMVSKPQLQLWLDRIWERYLTDDHKRAKIKVHGFGLTKIDLLWRYPWYSVDSTSWQQAGSNGRLILPPYGKTLAISNDSPSRKDAGQHFNTISDTEKMVMWELITSRGFDFHRTQETYLARWCFNLNAMEEINTALENKTGGEQVFDQPQTTLF